jgi:hypothetical protein
MIENDNSTEKMIQAAGLTAPRLSPAILQANIMHTEIVKHVTHGGQVLRWAVITTLSGFGVVGRPSVSVSPENDNEEIGIKVATENSTAEMWPLMGYELKQRLFNESQGLQALAGDALLERFNSLHRQYIAAGVEIHHRGGAELSGRPPYQQRVVDERDELADKVEKLSAFLGGDTYKRLADEEQTRLADQLAAMRQYVAVLNARIEAFEPQ